MQLAPPAGERGDEAERCPNPFCDGEGNIDVSTNASGRSRTYDTCEVGPHLPPEARDEADVERVVRVLQERRFGLGNDHELARAVLAALPRTDEAGVIERTRQRIASSVRACSNPVGEVQEQDHEYTANPVSALYADFIERLPLGVGEDE